MLQNARYSHSVPCLPPYAYWSPAAPRSGAHVGYCGTSFGQIVAKAKKLTSKADKGDKVLLPSYPMSGTNMSNGAICLAGTEMRGSNSAVVFAGTLVGVGGDGGAERGRGQEGGGKSVGEELEAKIKEVTVPYAMLLRAALY